MYVGRYRLLPAGGPLGVSCPPSSGAKHVRRSRSGTCMVARCDDSRWNGAVRLLRERARQRVSQLASQSVSPMAKSDGTLRESVRLAGLRARAVPWSG